MLLFSNHGNKLIYQLHAAYVNNRMKLAKKTLNANFESFHPIFCNLKNYQTVSLDVLKFLSKKREVIDFNTDRMKLQKTIYENMSFLDGIYKENRIYEIVENIYPNPQIVELEFLESIDIIKKFSPLLHEQFQIIISDICIISLQNKNRFIGGASDYNLIGLIFTGLKPHPYSQIALSISLVHELAHNVLMLLQSGQNPIKASDHKIEVYSGVRKTLRPSLMALHACIALGYMYYHSSNILKNEQVSSKQREFIQKLSTNYKKDLIDGIKALHTINFNEIGKLILEELTSLSNENTIN